MTRAEVMKMIETTGKRVVYSNEWLIEIETSFYEGICFTFDDDILVNMTVVSYSKR